MSNTKVWFCYRDGGNNAFTRCVVVRGGSPGHSEAMARLTRACEDIGVTHPVFVPRQVGLPEPYAWVEGPHILGDQFRRYPIWADMDHCWVGLNELQRTNAKPTDNRTLEELVADFERAAAEGWRLFDPASEYPHLVLSYSADEPPTPEAAVRVHELFCRPGVPVPAVKTPP